MLRVPIIYFLRLYTINCYKQYCYKKIVINIVNIFVGYLHFFNDIVATITLFYFYTGSLRVILPLQNTWLEVKDSTGHRLKMGRACWIPPTSLQDNNFVLTL